MQTPALPAAPDNASMLRKASLFADLDPATLTRLARHCRRRAYGRDTTLFEEGDPGHTLFVVVCGRVTVQKTSGDGAPIFVAERGVGECFGEMAVLSDAPRSASVVAQAGSELLLLDRADFLECVRHHPEVALAVIRSLSARLREASEQTLQSASVPVLGRLAAYLLSAAVPLQGADAIGLCPRPSDRAIGERIAATRETVSRKLTVLAQMKVISRSADAIVLLDGARLRGLSGG